MHRPGVLDLLFGVSQTTRHTWALARSPLSALRVPLWPVSLGLLGCPVEGKLYAQPSARGWGSAAGTHQPW